MGGNIFFQKLELLVFDWDFLILFVVRLLQAIYFCLEIANSFRMLVLAGLFLDLDF